ncbi:ABC-type Fe3+-siderophore transport system, permease component [Idiomarina sp. A28L]|uniref:FecCD family ABC transporter permease n=1 Tax=Idiomarina sp. A28L TaxID=1036674 RepID=UPI0002138BC3|nr:iron ABC transporter permease [Idiomarina sp. A28L]EGN74578.1 ABC-type Fe3+-siderophore transport system, permease component [Idiomarina sp. A28L]
MNLHRMILGVAIAITAIAALWVGSADVNVLTALGFPEKMVSDTTFYDTTPEKLVPDTTFSDTAISKQILFDIRIPRILLALITGAALGLAGAGMQGLLRNPLAEPGILGVSSGAALAAVIVLYFGFATWYSWLLPIAAVFGSASALLIVVLIAGMRASITTLILSGVAVSAFLSGLIALALSMAPSPFAMQEISFWLMGSLANRDLDQIMLISPFLLIGAILIFTSGRYLQALTLGEETATSMGFNGALERAKLLTGTALLVGGAVAVTGVIGFVGLVVPHILRPFVHGDPRRLLFSSMLAGALLVLLMDILVQLLPTGAELQVGVMATLIGGPFFLMLLVRHNMSGSLWGNPK